VFSILNKLKYFFLNKNEKLFILSNKNEDYVGNKKKIILINTIYDYFFLLLTKCITNLKNDYIFIGLDPYILPVRSKKYFIAKHISNILGFFFNKLLKIKWKKLYYSIRVKNIINFNIALKKDREKNKKIYLKIIKKIKKKEDILKISLYGINFGEIIYDTYLRFGRSPTVNINDFFLRKIIFKFIIVANNFDRFLFKNRNNIEALYTMYSSYIHHGLFVRYCYKYRIPVISIIQHSYTGARIKKITHRDNYSHMLFFLDFKKKFKMLKNKSYKLEQAKKELNKRFHGNKDKALFYVKNKNFSYKKNRFKKYLEKYKNITGVLFLHDYFDTPHAFFLKAFPDYYEWTIYTLNLIRKYKLNIAIKPHPNATEDSKEISNNIKKNYADLLWVDDQTNNLVFLSNKNFKFGITCNGTIIQELCYFNKIPIFLSHQSMSSFLNIKVPLNKEDYKNQILNYDKLYLPRNIKRSVLQSYYILNLNVDEHKQLNLMKILIASKFYTIDPSSSKKLFYHSNQIDSQIKSSNII
jgi:hypothetical protein